VIATGPINRRPRIPGLRTTILAFAALRPHRELADREDLDWSPRLLDRQERRRVEGEYEYAGADVPCDAARESLAALRRVSTRTARR
jgi:hypothetical protein